MVKARKKKLLDGTDKQIIRFIHLSKRPATANKIASRMNFSASGIKPRLDNLQNKGILKTVNSGKMRTFERNFKIKGNDTRKIINAPSKILWDIDLIKKRKKKN